ncbi:hypothetical protein MLD38_020899 [Melastoma candidum]|uniref:Uncharacterized protein n=1 Tax=Melastoma candidum TaxID=119954 RepID=A0ACB9QFC4_9MYRT|nr:hypothetical protein MLD38_020899 [Melastoma candidum]
MASFPILVFLVTAVLHSLRMVASQDFITESCQTTEYPTLCVQSLTPYAPSIQQNEILLAKTALELSLENSHGATSFVSQMTQTPGIGPRQSQAVRDCLHNVADSVNQLRQSIDELGQMGSGDFAWHMSNVQTWVSGALTDDNMCVQGFSGADMDGNVKVEIGNRVMELAKYVSNALALVSRIGSPNYYNVP